MLTPTKIILFFALLLFNITCFGQVKPKHLKKAHAHFEYKNYSSALPIYLDYLGSDQSSKEKLDVEFKAGYSYLNSSHKTKSLEHFKRVYDANPDYHPQLAYYLGQAYHYNHDFDNAIKFYQIYMDKASESEEKEKAKKRIQECQYGKEYVGKPDRVKVYNLGERVNTEYPEYVPLILPDNSEMIFTSRRPPLTKKERKAKKAKKEAKGAGRYKEDGMFYEDVFVSYKQGDQWTTPEKLDKSINTKYHDACVAIAPKGDLVFLYRPGKSGQGDIFSSSKKGKKWSKPKILKHVNTKEYGEISVTVSDDENTIYFSSDRPGGYGGFDLYKSVKNGNSWGDPVNLGPEINTPYNEDAPFLHDDNTLYFSSQGHNTMGGYDIFVSKKEGDKWSNPTNIGYPINTADNDIYFVISEDNKTGYYSSVREDGFGEQDIYEIDFLPEPEIFITILKGTVVDKKSQNLLLSDIAINKEENTVQEIQSNNPEGNFSTEVKENGKYKLIIKSDGYFAQTSEVYVPEAEENQTIELKIELERMVMGYAFPVKVLFEYNKYDLSEQAKKDLDEFVKILKENPEVTIEVSGHTDNIGTRDRNIILSEKRANAALEYLIQQGINKNRFRKVGHAFDQPIDTNKTPEGRQNNRRTDFKIVDFKSSKADS